MKTTIKKMSLLVCGLVLFAYKSHAQHKLSLITEPADSLVCLEISGEIDRNFRTPAGTYTVVLIHHNTPVDTAIVKDDRSFRFRLSKNAYYALRIYKKGFAPKLVSINTDLPDEVFNDALLRFHFEAELITEQDFETLDSDTRDFPIAIVSFQKDKKAFNYNEKYTRNIWRKLLQKKNPMLF